MKIENETDYSTPASLLPEFYAKNNLEMDGGLSSPSVRIDLNKNFHFYIPNYNARRKAVLWHDIHHLVTGYSAATFLGECEISAWEIASGCGKYWAAFVIDTSGVVLGCFIHPRKIVQAYARGRRTMNLYHDTYHKEQVMHMDMDELRKALLLDRFPKETSPTGEDWVRFGLFFVFASLYSVLSIVSIPFVIGYTIWHTLRKKIN